ncbi:HTH domain-containing protein [Streptomyces sp. HUCO-GS316]|nr:HTH domain-containing protein [Streptomyces sp. HUCO-GS316]
MPRPTGRVLTLLELLQSGGTRSVAELADRLGVEGRTVRRYVDQLIDLDVPVESVRGRYGGYRLAPGYRLPGAVWWTVGALWIMPANMGMPVFQWNDVTSSSLGAHLVFGLLAGATFAGIAQAMGKRTGPAR